MDSFFSRLESRAQQTGSLLCVGLDPHPQDLPAPTAEAARDFCLQLIEATADLAAAFKPNAAFFEALGPEGMLVLKEIIAAVPEGVPVILDAKRGDIASTGKAYARAAFELLGADAITANPYLGYDALAPFLEDPTRGVFVLCKTSNPGSADLQDLQTYGRKGLRLVYEQVAHLAQEWNQNDNLGLVAGATHLEALKRIRELAPGLWILAPGVGAQGGDLRLALQAGLRQDGLGLLVPVSRGISRTANPRQAAETIRAEIEQARRSHQGQAGRAASPEQSAIADDPHLRALADDLLASGCVKFAEPGQPYLLKSGLKSPIYIDLRQLVSNPGLLLRVAQAYLHVLNELEFDRLAALPYAALPIGTAISLLGGWPLVYPRKEVKTYGTQAEIEGAYSPGERVVLIDDLTTTGGSKFEAIERLNEAGLQVADVVVLIDRQSGAAESLARAGLRLLPVFSMIQLLDYWQEKGSVPIPQIAAVRAFLGLSA
ncbi:MAG TPA: orotidine-5'-phosphate decarboxylase [Anaerolineales bacterium]|nr:orotidine-5'-phosphate decarboxylase [Anaerolineales bacterium]